MQVSSFCQQAGNSLEGLKSFPAKGVRGHAPPENFEIILNSRSHIFRHSEEHFKAALLYIDTVPVGLLGYKWGSYLITSGMHLPATRLQWNPDITMYLGTGEITSLYRGIVKPGFCSIHFTVTGTGRA